MNVITDILLGIVSYLPKFINFWLYSPKRTEKNIDVSISASSSSIEVWCGQKLFNVWVTFRNNNPFPVEVDRLEVRAILGSAELTATENMGVQIAPRKDVRLLARGKFDASAETQIKSTKDDSTINIVINAVLINKFYCIRNYIRYLENQFCRIVNKKIINI